MNSNLFGRRWKLTVSTNASLTWSLINLDLILSLTSTKKKSKHVSNNLTMCRALGASLILSWVLRMSQIHFSITIFYYPFSIEGWAFSKGSGSTEANTAVGVGFLCCLVGRYWEPGSDSLCPLTVLTAWPTLAITTFSLSSHLKRLRMII